MTLFKNKYRIESARLKHWDYTSAGWYFVTFCTRGLECFFGEVESGEMRLSPLGEYACECWLAIPQHTARPVRLDEYVLMPNHLHGILILEDTPVETLHCNVSTLPGNVSTRPATRDPNDPHAQIAPHAGSVSALIRSYKSAVTYWSNRNGFQAFAWQPRFYDRIIRNENELARIRQYIVNNPSKWELERNNPERLWR